MQGRGNREGFDYNDFAGAGEGVPGPPALEVVVQRERERVRGKSSGSDGYTLQGTDRPDWQGHLHSPGQAQLLGRAERCPGDGPRAKQAAAGGTTSS